MKCQAYFLEKQTICLKCQSLLSGKNDNNFSSAKFAYKIVKVALMHDVPYLT